jgi:hypothetical protein
MSIPSIAASILPMLGLTLMSAGTGPGTYDFWLDPRASKLTPLRGGAGGQPYALTCADDEVMVGITGRSSATITALGAVCARMLPAGHLVNVHAQTPIGGSSGMEFQRVCPIYQAVVGIHGGATTGLDRLGLRCARVASWVLNGKIDSSVAPAGGSGGQVFSDLCPGGYVGHGLLGGAGSSWILSTQAQCIRVTL